MSQELKDLACEIRWYIGNRWMVKEQQVDAKRLADKLVALAEGEALDSVAPPEPSPVPLEEGLSDSFMPPEWLVKDDVFPIVGKRFKKNEFIQYVKWVQENEPYSWDPKGITMHHTGFPDLSIRPNGFTEQHMRNMRHGYLHDKGWKHGPHIFTDEHGIWVFNPLSVRGVHAVSYNSTRYGIEMLGNFDSAEDFAHERGVASRSHGKFAAAVLMKYAGISTAKLNFHRHDPETSKTCPGKHVDFSGFEDEVLTLVEKV